LITGLIYVEIEDDRSPGARIITQYFPTESNTKACFTIEYLMSGNGPKSLYLIQQEKINYCVWQGRMNRAMDGRWIKEQVPIDLNRGSPRFFIEAQFTNDKQRQGIIAIAQLGFKCGPCSGNGGGGGRDIDTDNFPFDPNRGDQIPDDQPLATQASAQEETPFQRDSPTPYSNCDINDWLDQFNRDYYEEIRTGKSNRLRNIDLP